MTKREITAADLMPIAEYVKVRATRRQAITRLKVNRRLAIGPDATLYFECFETMWHQIHEMLYIEKGGAAQVSDELRAYNPLVPKGAELVATLMFEIDEPGRRARLLASLGGVENTVNLSFDGETVGGVPEADVERTAPDGKASSVQFLHFPFSRAQIEKFRRPGAEVIVGIGHPRYRHLAAMPEAMRAALALDFD